MLPKHDDIFDRDWLASLVSPGAGKMEEVFLLSLDENIGCLLTICKLLACGISRKTFWLNCARIHTQNLKNSVEEATLVQI